MGCENEKNVIIQLLGEKGDPGIGTKGDAGAAGSDGNSIPGSDGGDGESGWSPLLRVVDDGDRKVMEIYDWEGGTGTKPAINQYLGAIGLTPVLAEGNDVRGAQGITGDSVAGAGVNINSIKLIDSQGLASFNLSTGLGSGIWADWALCDGRNGTQDMRGRTAFQLSYTDAGAIDDGDFYPINTVGGFKTTTLVKQNLPEHQHEASGNGATVAITTNSGQHSHLIRVTSANRPGEATTGLGTNVGQTGGFPSEIVDGAHTHSNSTFSGNTGESIALDSRPLSRLSPYRVLAYVKKIA